MVSIREIIEKYKSKETYTALVIIVVGFGSFGLGRLSILLDDDVPVIVEGGNAASIREAGNPRAKGVEDVAAHVETVSSQARAESSNGLLVGSKSGKKYHFPWCSGAQRISEANKIWFASYEEARIAGYVPANNCKGLK